MSRPQNLLGFKSAPKIGSRYDNDCGCNSNDDSRNQAPGNKLSPFERIQDDGNFLAYRAVGVHTVLPMRAVSAQTRLKNMAYELPSAVWTNNPEGPAYLVRVPGIPTRVGYMPYVSDTSTQPAMLSPVANLQMQNNYSWFGRLRSLVLGNFASQEDQNQNLAVMFPYTLGTGE